MDERTVAAELGAEQTAASNRQENGAAAPAPGSGAVRLEGDPFGRFLKVRDVAVSVGLSRAMIYRLMREAGDPFPAPVKVGAASLWIEREVVAWKARRAEARAGWSVPAGRR
jgi:predicted DNA-binding transcriptional regulator AlpA